MARASMCTALEQKEKLEAENAEFKVAIDSKNLTIYSRRQEIEEQKKQISDLKAQLNTAHNASRIGLMAEISDLKKKLQLVRDANKDDEATIIMDQQKEISDLKQKLEAEGFLLKETQDQLSFQQNKENECIAELRAELEAVENLITEAPCDFNLEALKELFK